MKIQVNNKETELPSGATVGQLAEQLQLPGKGAAIAVNNRLVTRAAWNTHVLAENDSVVVIKAACGG